MGTTTLHRGLATETLTPALIAELMPLLRAHYCEVAHWQDLPLDPDWDAYARIQYTGGFRVYTLRTDAGELIGYSAWFVSRSLHYQSSIFANEDVLYVDPRHRGAALGTQLIRYAHAQLAAEGITVAFHHCKHAARLNLGPFLERRLGCEQVDDIWAKRLDGGG